MKTKDREIELEATIRGGMTARNAIAMLVTGGVWLDSEKQGRNILAKWERKGRWEYGVSIDLGWFVDQPRGS